MLNAIDVGQEAIKYARKNISIGNTWIESNSYLNTNISFFKKLEKNIHHLRNEIKSICRNEDEKMSFIRLEKNPIVNEHEVTIDLTTLHSLGNCDELSRNVFDYVLNTSACDSIIWDVEIVEVVNGDHVIVVFNRNPESNLNDPKTWNKSEKDKAVIVDAYARKVFYAEDYLSNLNYYYRDPFNVNHTDLFNPKEHSLKLKNQQLNLNYFKKHRKPENLISTFNERCQLIATNILKMENISVENKINVIKQTTNLQNKASYLTGNYREINMKLTDMLKKLSDMTGVFETWRKLNTEFIDEQLDFDLNYHTTNRQFEDKLKESDISNSDKYNIEFRDEFMKDLNSNMNNMQFIDQLLEKDNSNSEKNILEFIDEILIDETNNKIQDFNFDINFTEKVTELNDNDPFFNMLH
jgi:hypothetical protein